MSDKKVKLSDILRDVKARLNGDEIFICIILEDHVKIGTEEQREELQQWIENDLLGEPGNSYGGWLLEYHPSVHARYKKLSNAGKAKARRPWVDWMIQYWEGKGQ